MLKWEVEKGSRYCFWEKGNFMLIYEFKYGQTWKIWPSSLNLSLWNAFKGGEKEFVVTRFGETFADDKNQFK